MLIGHIKQELGGTTSQWQLLLAPDEWEWNITAKDPAAIFSQLVNTISDTLAERYSAVVSNGVQSHIVVQVIGMKQQADLSQLLKYLQQLTPVADVQLKNVVGDSITLDVNLRGSVQSFMQAAALGTVLVPVFSGGMPQTGALQYKWNQ